MTNDKMKNKINEATDAMFEVEKNEKIKKQKKSNGPKPTTKEDLYRSLNEHLPDLQDLARNLNTLVQNLERSRSADVSLSFVDDATNVLKNFDKGRKSVSALKNVLVSRARSRLNGVM